MLEVLAPAGSSDALVAAVQNGADAVYLGCGNFNARMNAKNFTGEQLRQSVSYCHIRGVKVYLTLNTLVLDRELRDVGRTILDANRAGVDAILVQDLGVLHLVQTMAPDIPIHASTQMSVYSLEGVRKAASLGISRVVLARELSRDQISLICRDSPIETEVFVHGALCMCYSGQCYMSAVIGRRSGNRGQCAQPCRMPYGFDRCENRYPLSLKDNCLVGYMRELNRIGVTCVKIEGRMKRAEYVAIATRIYKQAALGHRITAEQLCDLRKVFSRQGFTDGYYTGCRDDSMFGIHQDDGEDSKLFSQLRTSYESRELQRVPVRFHMSVRAGQPVTLTVSDEENRRIQCRSILPEIARRHALTQQELAERLRKTGGTPYYASSISLALDPGMSVSAATVNSLRRTALDRLSAQRGQVRPVREGKFPTPNAYHSASPKKPDYTVSVQTARQITPQLLAFHPDVLYLPLPLAVSGSPRVADALRKVTVCAVLPRVIWDNQWEAVYRQLAQARLRGIHEVLVGNLSMVDPVQRAGFDVRGDFGLNITNSHTANLCGTMGFKSLTASFELTLTQIRGLSKPVPTEIFAYGRLPLMVTENCVIRSRTGSCTCGSGQCSLIDRTGSRFPVMRDGDTCRSIIYNSRKLYWADRLSTLSNLGLWALRLNFTTENDQQVNAVLQDYLRGRAFDPGVGTRGLYLRGVE